MIKPTIQGRGNSRKAAAAYLERIVTEMTERGVRPGRLNILAAATDYRLPSKTVTIIARLANRRFPQPAQGGSTLKGDA